MARLPIALTTEGEVVLAAAATETLIQWVAPTNQRGALKSFGVGFKGVSSSAEPVRVQLIRQTSAGTSSAATPFKEDGLGSEAIQFTARKLFTAEPTDGGEILRDYPVHPQTGIERVFGPDEEIIIPGAGRLGLRVITPTGVNPNAVAFMTLEE